jgi:hypothetical protein
MDQFRRQIDERAGQAERSKHATTEQGLEIQADSERKRMAKQSESKVGVLKCLLRSE